MNMQKLTPKLVLLLAISFQMACSGGGDSGSSSAPSLTCPTNYINVPALAGYTTEEFCVAKYEMKNNSGAKSEPTGLPWGSINRNNARSECQNIGAGYDLISNAQWQAIARNVADQGANWSSGVAYNGELNRGHSDGAPNSSLAADSSDANACANTGETCSNTVWDSQKRTHVLSNGQVIWDLSGNVEEFTRDDVSVSPGADDNIAAFSSGAIQTDYGNDQFCASPSSAPYCGFGYAIISSAGGAVTRGGQFSTGFDRGIFSVELGFSPTNVHSYAGFRCVYRP